MSEETNQKEKFMIIIFSLDQMEIIMVIIYFNLLFCYPKINLPTTVISLIRYEKMGKRRKNHDSLLYLSLYFSNQ
jgi:hypothetical protein